TITQRTTLPFLIAESGAASFTLAVMMSPRPARSPRSPPRGKMHCNLRAPLLSATSNMVRIPIMTFLPKKPLRTLKLLLFERLLRARIGSSFERRMIDGDLYGAPDHHAQLPSFQAAQRTALNDSHHISNFCGLRFVMHIELLALHHNSLIHGMSRPARHLDNDSFCHFCRNNFADLFGLVSQLF